MAIKKEEPSSQMLVDTSAMDYGHKLLVSAADAATLLEIYGRANRIYDPYNADKDFKAGLNEGCLRITPIPTETVDELKKAKFMGITHTEYLEGINAKSGTTTSEETV